MHDRLLPIIAGVLPLILTAALGTAATAHRAQEERDAAMLAGFPALAADVPAWVAPEPVPPTSVPPASGQVPGVPSGAQTDAGIADEPDTSAKSPPSATLEAPVAGTDITPTTEQTEAEDLLLAGAPTSATTEPVAPAPAGPQADTPAPAEAPATDGPPPASRTTAAVGADTPGEAAPRDERSDSERIFSQEYPTHAAARQTDDPATRSWAVLVGVNRYQGRTSNTLGSVADVLVLRQELLRSGWRDDHILVITDVAATHDRIIRGIEWLIRSTDPSSTVVFSFSGHMRHDRGVSALWPTDNRFIWAPDLGRMLGAVPAGRLWASLQGCHAEGMRAPGLEGPGRVITYSSQTAQKSYEDPEVGHSVQGFYLFAEGFRDRFGDADGDGMVSVQEAWRWAAPRAHTRTAQQQTPVISDGLGTPFHLGIGS